MTARNCQWDTLASWILDKFPEAATQYLSFELHFLSCYWALVEIDHFMAGVPHVTLQPVLPILTWVIMKPINKTGKTQQSLIIKWKQYIQDWA